MSSTEPGISRALALLPCGFFVLTAAYENKRSGTIVRWVQPCAQEPLLISVAARRGHSIEPLIRDSHCFAICRVDADDKLLSRKFAVHRPPDDMSDPFDAVGVETMVTGSPIIRRASLVLDCEVVRHFDLEADHELFIGLVRAARVSPGARA
jgi:flavin reductase (DIM6/NTAB) family NADH-FMN oxidoreductase RutF